MIRIEYLYEKISILHKKQLINERYTCGNIGAHGIQIRGEVGAHCCVSERWWVNFKCLECLHTEKSKYRWSMSGYCWQMSKWKLKTVHWSTMSRHWLSMSRALRCNVQDISRLRIDERCLDIGEWCLGIGKNALGLTHVGYDVTS